MEERTVVFTTNELIKARLVQGFLNSHGIDAIVSPFSSLGGDVDVAVLSTQKTRALELIQKQSSEKQNTSFASAPPSINNKPIPLALPQICPHCKTLYEPDSNFCDQCGEPVDSEPEKVKEPEKKIIPKIEPPKVSPRSPVEIIQAEVDPPLKNESSFKPLMALVILTIRAAFYILAVRGLGQSVSLPALILMTLWGFIPYFMLHSVSNMMRNAWSLRIGTMFMLGAEVYANCVVYLFPPSSAKPLMFLFLPVFQIALVMPIASLVGAILKKVAGRNSPNLPKPGVSLQTEQNEGQATSEVVSQENFRRPALAVAVGSIVVLGLLFSNYFKTTGLQTIDIPIVGDLGDDTKVQIGNEVISRLSSEGLEREVMSQFPDIDRRKWDGLSMGAQKVLKTKGYPPENVWITLSIRYKGDFPPRESILNFCRERIQNELDVRLGEESAKKAIDFPSLELNHTEVPAISKSNELLTGSRSKYRGEQTVRMNPLVELDFKTKEEVLTLRKNHVSPYLGIILDNYQPSEAVFGQIQDRKAWWGIYGLYFYGNGERSIEGPSGQSKFICNPFVLVGLSERNAYITSARPDESLAFYPKPIELKWQNEKSLAMVKYEVSTHFNHLIKNDYPNKRERKLSMIAYNARDFGLNYLFLDAAKSTNVESLDKSGGAIQLREFIHLGNSCGYAGGCNNISPYQPELEIDVKSLPAKATLKLWKEKPRGVGQEADMVFIIEMN